MIEPLLLTVPQFQRELGSVGRDTIYQLVHAGRIRCVRMNRKILIPRSELEAFIEREIAESRTA
jgi:excisionase family DNA binding protein